MNAPSTVEKPASFSVVIPVYNHAKFLGASVRSALCSPLVCEILLVDDGSTDESRRLISQFAAQYPDRVRDLTPAEPHNLGAPRRLNQLVEAAGCEWVAVLNSDDCFVAGRFEVLRARLRLESASFAWGHLLIMNEAGSVIGTKRGVFEPEFRFPAGFDLKRKLAKREFADLLANQNFIATTSGMVFTRTLHRRLGGFRDFRYVHDWDFALRAVLDSDALYLPHYLTCYRDHRANTIKDGEDGVKTEVRQLFDEILRDHGELRQQRDFEAGLRGNRYLDG